MAEQTAIAWATHTFNPWIGCTKLSPACDQCREAGVAVFVKQLGTRPVDAGVAVPLRHRKGEDLDEWPDDLRCQEAPVDTLTQAVVSDGPKRSAPAACVSRRE